MKRLLLPLLAFASAAYAPAQSNIPGVISYQGRVADAAGVPIGNTAPVNRTVIFRIWDSPSSTTPASRLYSEQQNVTISGGEFSVLVGTGTPVAGETGNAFSAMSAAVFNGQTRFLGVTVDDGDGNPANDAEASPRQQVVTTPFAFRAQVAEAVANGGVASSALANDAVGAAALAAGAVTGTKIAASAVGTAALADSSVTSGKLAVASVTTNALADGSVTGAKLAAGGIDATKLADGTIVLAKLSAASVDSSKIVDGSVAAADLGTGAVETAKLADGAVTAAKLGAGAVETAKLADGSVSLAKQGANSVDSSKIVDGSIALADLTTTVREGLPKQRHIYSQAVGTSVDSKGRILVPIDLGDLGNDVDGCVIHYYGWARNGALATDSRIGTIRIYIQQPGFSNDPNFPNITWATAAHHHMNTGNTGTHAFGTVNFRLNPQALNNGTTVFASVDDWCSFWNFYPGSLRPGETAPFNVNQEPNASNANAGGYPQVFNVASVVTGANKLTITLDNPHAIQVGDTLNITGMTGLPSANGTGLVVTAQPDRTSFEIALNGAAGTYSGGTVTHQPKYNRFRIWAAVAPSVSMRFIVSDR